MPIANPSRPSSGRFPVRASGALAQAAAATLPLREELASTRSQVEEAPLLKLDRPTRPADPPPVDLAARGRAFAASPLGREIANARALVELSPTPSTVEALESYCVITRGGIGAAPNDDEWQPSDDDEELILNWGSLLGEAIIATYGGVSEFDTSASVT